MTRRERMEARAERRDEWAAGRRDKAQALDNQNKPFRGDIAFFTQPGRVIERERFYERGQHAYDHGTMAEHHGEKADGIRRALRTSIFDDDTDARERMEEKIARLEEQRERIKAYNVSCRKGSPDLSLLSERQQESMLGMIRANQISARGNGAMPRYVLSNLGANITRFKKRLTALDQPKPVRTIEARRDGDCNECSEPIEAGALISRVEGVWIHAHHAS